MRRLLAILGGLLGILLVPLGLSGPTALLLLPAHLVFTLIAALAPWLEGFRAQPERARRWGLFHLVASIGMVAALEVGSTLRHERYWVVPWTFALLWGWMPIVSAGLAGGFGEGLRRFRVRRVVRRRRGG